MKRKIKYKKKSNINKLNTMEINYSKGEINHEEIQLNKDLYHVEIEEMNL